MPAARPGALVVLELAPMMSIRHRETRLRCGFLLEPLEAATDLASPNYTCLCPGFAGQKGRCPFRVPYPLK